MYQFLGNVNQFHSHVHEGEAKIGEIGLKIDAHHTTQNSPAIAYVRPHDIEIHKVRNGVAPAFEALVSYIHAIGPLVRLELQPADQSELVEAELTQERFRELQLTQGENVFVYPRNVRVFLEEGSHIKLTQG